MASDYLILLLLFLILLLPLPLLEEDGLVPWPGVFLWWNDKYSLEMKTSSFLTRLPLPVSHWLMCKAKHKMKDKRLNEPMCLGVRSCVACEDIHVKLWQAK